MTGARRCAWIAFWIISAHYIIGNFHRVCPAMVAPELSRAFGISGASSGILASIYFFAYGAMQIPVGILADVWGGAIPPLHNPRMSVSFQVTSGRLRRRVCRPG
jgi:MFS family permease